MKLTNKQREVVETLAVKGWSIRRAFVYGGMETYYWNAPTLTPVNAKVFDCLKSKRLIEMHDDKLKLWRLSEAGREAAKGGKA